MNELTNMQVVSVFLTFTLVFYKYLCQLVVRLSSLKLNINKHITVNWALWHIQPYCGIYLVTLLPNHSSWLGHLYLYEWVLAIELEDSM